jgi:hypothetical protein
MHYKMSETYRGDITPFELITRCHGTVLPLKGAAGSLGRCFRDTPTWRGLCAVEVCCSQLTNPLVRLCMHM